MGITQCSTHNENTYMISCDYISGCDKTGCSYNLTSVNDILTNTIQDTKSDIIEIQDSITYILTVTDMEGFVVQSKELDISDVSSCLTIG